MPNKNRNDLYVCVSLDRATHVNLRAFQRAHRLRTMSDAIDVLLERQQVPQALAQADATPTPTEHA